jgi:hypothetical protein
VAGLLIENLIPLYILIGLGYISGRWMDVNLHSLATIAIYILSPVVVFGAVIKIDLDPSFLFLPVLVFTIAAIITLMAHRLSAAYFKSNMANLVGMASGTGNTGYFGLPIILALLGPEAAGIYLLMNIGILMNELTFGYYVGARGHHTPKDSLRKAICLPALHAAWIGLLFNALDVSMPQVFDTYWNYFTGSWVVIGMMLIGIGLGKIEHLRPNLALISWLFGFRFIIWPLAMLSCVYLDRLYLKIYGEDIHQMLMIIGVVPLAANVVAYAGHLKLSASEAAMAVLLSTIFALVYIPFMLSFFS